MGDRVSRLVKMLDIIDRYSRIGPRELAEKLEISKRQVYRDLQLLETKFPIYHDRKTKSYKLWKEYNGFRKLGLSKSEVVSLLLGEKIISKYKGTPYEKAIKLALKKIQKRLPKDTEVFSAGLKEYFFIDVRQAKDYAPVINWFGKAFEAMRERKTIEIEYYALGKDEQAIRKVNPYGFILSLGAWYIIGYCHLRQDIRTFALDRIINLQLTEKEFKRPATFSLDEYFKGGWHLFSERLMKVEIRFSPDISHLIKERIWHPSQTLKDEPDGSVIAAFNVAGTEEIKRWVLGFGSSALVLSPKGLKEEIKGEIERLREMYK
ncbi:MAG: hypothetical protein COS84_08400 [Armatimonadetes bacterium CG07_land_8_20_14_0_80_40_9]|nr:MAG: hypothetical protein COS84_08400 [Armatimonadetes bacterium CG07_land_8_20_14_0_80_40_9]